MAAVDMSFDNMIHNRRNSVRGGGRGRGMRSVRGPGGMFGGDGRLAGPPRRGHLGMYGLGGKFRGAGRLAMIQNRRNSVRCVGLGRGMRGVKGAKGTFGVDGRLAGPPRRGPLGMYGLGGTFRGAGGLAGPSRRGPLGIYSPGGTCRDVGRLARPPRRGSMCTNAVAKNMCRTGNVPWQTNVLEGRFKAVGSSGVESGTKLQVSNLSDGVSDEDIRELFSEIGELVRYGIHYDKNGSPCSPFLGDSSIEGSAEVVFARRTDALQAVKRYNNTQFHGKSMTIEHLGSLVRARVASRLNVTGGANGRRRGPGYMRNTAVLDDGAGPSNQRGCGGWTGRVHIRGRGGRGERPEEKSAEELDKELDNHQAETTHIEEQQTV